MDPSFGMSQSWLSIVAGVRLEAAGGRALSAVFQTVLEGEVGRRLT